MFQFFHQSNAINFGLPVCLWWLRREITEPNRILKKTVFIKAFYANIVKGVNK